MSALPPITDVGRRIQVRIAYSQLVTPSDCSSQRKIEPSHGVFLHAGKHMRVGVECNPDTSVSQALTYHLGMSANFQQMRGVRVSKVMKPKSLHA